MNCRLTLNFKKKRKMEKKMRLKSMRCILKVISDEHNIMKSSFITSAFSCTMAKTRAKIESSSCTGLVHSKQQLHTLHSIFTWNKCLLSCCKVRTFCGNVVELNKKLHTHTHPQNLHRNYHSFKRKVDTLDMLHELEPFCSLLSLLSLLSFGHHVE